MSRFEGAGRHVPPGAGLDGLRRAAAECQGCDLHAAATQTVFSTGSASARIALIGEQPGDQEDRQGAPFVGPAGKLLDRALAEAGIDRSDAYVTNTVKHFRFTQDAPGKRRIHQTPDPAQMTACRPWLTAELHIIDPDVIVLLGATAAKALLGPSFRVTRQRGRIIPRPPIDDETARQNACYVATVHPSAVLRADDRDAAYAGLVADLKIVAEVVG